MSQGTSPGLEANGARRLERGDRWGRAADAARFAVGTLTRVPVPAPRRLDRRVAAAGLVLAPLVGALVGVASGLPLLLAAPDPMHRLLASAVAVAVSVWLTRGLHWDGLADTADGLGAAGGPARVLAVMRRSDIGPFGVMALVLVALVQVVALACLPAGAPALAGWVCASAAGRWAIVVACGPWSAPARSEGLGALVIGEVRKVQVAASCAVLVAVPAAAWAAAAAPPAALPAVLVGAPVAMLVSRSVAARAGGSTGDTLGATCELATTATLLVLAWP